MHKLCGGKVPPLHAAELNDTDEALIADIESAKAKVETAIEQYKFREALFEVIDLARKGNKYLQDKEPWKKTEAEQKSIDNTLHLCLQLTANLAVLVNPFLPFTAKKLCYMMKVVDKMLEWKNAGRIKLLSVGYALRAPELLFRKIENEEIEKQIEKLKKASQILSEGGTSDVQSQSVEKTPPKEEFKEAISIDDFTKIKLRTGTILSAEKVEKADKLLKLQIDMGTETRTIVSGIAQHFSPEQIIGKQVTVVANLAPRKMRGIESNGMILMAEDKNGKLHFINPEEKIDNGSEVR
jgi:methionyl-tRNA synthetase